MEKLRTLAWRWIKNDCLRKMLMIMKFTVALFLCTISQLMATEGYSQVTRLSLDLKNVMVKTVLSEIEDNSEFYFLYNSKLVDVERKVSIDLKNRKIDEILNELFKGTDVIYAVVDRQIVLSDASLASEKGFMASLQQRQISGKITNIAGESLPGATILVKGTSIGTISDSNGNYSLTGVPAEGTLVFSFVGMKTQEIQVMNKSVINVTLREETVGIEEVVAIGYGTSSKRAVTGSISKVKSDVLLNNTSQNVGVGLQGRVAGVQITQNSGNPEADINIRVRGVSSVYAGSQPLLVIDGVVASLSLRELNPNDIASIEILKDAASAAIYGSRAANGVVLVTTKAGIVGKSQVEFQYTYGSNAVTNWLPIANGSQYLTIMDNYWQNVLPSHAGQQFTNFAINGLDGFNRAMAATQNTNWKNIVTQPSYYNQYSLSASSGSEKTKVFMSAQYRDEYGYDAGLRLRTAYFRMNVDHKVNKWATVGAKINGNFSFRNNAYASYSDYYGSLLPIYPIMSPSTLPTRAGRYFYDRNLTGDKGINPIYRHEQSWADQEIMRNVGDVYLELKPFKGLVIRTDWGGRFDQSRSRNYASRDYTRPGDASLVDNTQAGSIGYGRYETFRYTGSNTITYDNSIANHSLSVLVGNSVESYSNMGQSNVYEGFPTDYFTLTNANTNPSMTRQSASVDQYRFIGFFGRARYDFRRRYFLDINYRADYSSRFGFQNRWGYFPGAAVSWVLSDENFMKNITFLNYAKIRISRGAVGNGEVGNYPYLSGVVNWGTYGQQPGFLFNNIGNNSIHWEKQVQTDIGLDYTIFNNRISGSFDYFVKDVTDLIVNNKINNYMGFYTTAIVQNLGGMKNKGFDFDISTKNLIGEFKWVTDFNISHSKSMITKLSPAQRFIQSGVNMVVTGQPLGAYYLPIYAGLDPVTGHEMVYNVKPNAEWTRAPLATDLDGRVVDYNRSPNMGNNSVLLTDKTPYPKLYGGITNSFSYKGFDLFVNLTYQWGNYIYDSGIQSLMTVSTTGSANMSPDLAKAWTKANPTNIPLLSAGSTTRFLYDGSYMRLKNVMLAYTLPKSIMEMVNFDGKLTFKAGAQNLLTFTKFPGIDPEFFQMSIGATDPSGGNLGGNISPGIANLSNPQVRTLYFSVNLSF
jgi:TonB-dependent starch-binding outer membrane protein SusC